MALPTRFFRNKRGLLVPGGTPTIDWGNPLASQLSCCFVPYASSALIPDLVTGNALAGNSASAPVVAGPAGMRARANSGSNAWANTTLDPRWHPVSFGFSVLMLIAPLGVPSTSPIVMFGPRISGPGTLVWGVNRTTGDTSTDLVISYNVSGTAETITVPSFFSSSSSGIYALAFSVALNGNYYVYRNGVLFATGTVPGTGTISGSPLGMYLGGLSGTGNANVDIYMAAAWSQRILQPGDLQALSFEPTAFLQFARDRVFQLEGASPSSSITISVSETAPATDTFTLTDIAGISVSEAVTATDTITLVADISDSETAAATDTFSNYTQTSITETVSATDSPNLDAIISDSETAAATDTVALTPSIAVADDETLTATDAVTLDAVVRGSETAPASDVVNLGGGANVSETVSATDAITLVADISDDETVSAAETFTVTVSGEIPISVVETAAATDTVGVNNTAPISVLETAAAVDLSTITALIAQSEITIPTDIVEAFSVSNIGVDESVSALDNFTIAFAVTFVRRWVYMNKSIRTVPMNLSKRTVTLLPD